MSWFKRKPRKGTPPMNADASPKHRAIVDSAAPITLTHSQARAAEARYQELIADLQARRAASGEELSPHDYWVYKGLFAAAYGAEQVTIVPDPQ
jgi:hypothetical protein